MRTTKIQFAYAGSDATIVKMACERVEGFSVLYTSFERKMSIAGKSLSTITNYGWHIADVLGRGVTQQFCKPLKHLLFPKQEIKNENFRTRIPRRRQTIQRKTHNRKPG